MSKALRFSAALSLVLVLVAAVFGVWRVGYGQGQGVIDGAKVSGFIEYSARDASGAVKEHRLIKNTTVAALLNDARARLGATDGVFTGLGNSDLYDNIQACSADASGASCTLSSNLDANPADGTNATATESGNYTTTKTFTASGASTIEELQLTKGSATSGTADTGIGAFQNVSITLASGDTLQVTWTIDID